ncbi:MAG: metalloregulator ArsR/SmtB family transcription factor [Candidatus Neomarinimicrobiota bacterium]
MAEIQHCEHLDQAVMDHLKVKLNNFPELEMTAATFEMLGNLSRLRILYILFEIDHCSVNQLAEVMDMSAAALSNHLRYLRDRKLVKTQRDGSNIYYSLAASEKAAEACKIAKRILGMNNPAS